MPLVLPLETREVARQQLGLLTREAHRPRDDRPRDRGCGPVRRAAPGPSRLLRLRRRLGRGGAHPPPPRPARARGCGSVGGGAMPLAADTAAWVWALPRPPRRRDGQDTVHLVNPTGPGARGRDWVLHRAAVPPEEITVRGAYLLTSASRTVVDLARGWREVDAVAAVDAALLRGLTTTEDLLAVLDQHATVAGTPAVRRVLDLADGRAESWLETCGRLAFAAGGLPPFLPQVEILLDGELLKVVDGWYRRQHSPWSSTGARSTCPPPRPTCGRRNASRTSSGPSASGSSGSPTRCSPAGGQRCATGSCASSVDRVRPTARVHRAPPQDREGRGGTATEDGWLWRASDAVGGPGGPRGLVLPGVGGDP